LFIPLCFSPSANLDPLCILSVSTLQQTLILCASPCFNPSADLDPLCIPLCFNPSANLDPLCISLFQSFSIPWSFMHPPSANLHFEWRVV
jgi:hypothetical protein